MRLMKPTMLGFRAHPVTYTRFFEKMDQLAAAFNLS